MTPASFLESSAEKDGIEIRVSSVAQGKILHPENESVKNSAIT